MRRRFQTQADRDQLEREANAYGDYNSTLGDVLGLGHDETPFDAPKKPVQPAIALPPKKLPDNLTREERARERKTDLLAEFFTRHGWTWMQVAALPLPDEDATGRWKTISLLASRELGERVNPPHSAASMKMLVEKMRGNKWR